MYVSFIWYGVGSVGECSMGESCGDGIEKGVFVCTWVLECVVGVVGCGVSWVIEMLVWV